MNERIRKAIQKFLEKGGKIKRYYFTSDQVSYVTSLVHKGYGGRIPQQAVGNYWSGGQILGG